MFKQKATPMFNNKMFKTGTILPMRKDVTFHASATRLYKAAQEMKGIKGQSAVARLLNESPQRVRNWEARGVSKEGALLAEDVIGCSALWILTGQGFMEKLDGNSISVETAKEQPVKHFPSTAPPWPFRSISAKEYDTLTDEDKEKAEGYVRFLLHEGTQKKGRPNKISANGH